MQESRVPFEHKMGIESVSVFFALSIYLFDFAGS